MQLLVGGGADPSVEERVRRGRAAGLPGPLLVAAQRIARGRGRKITDPYQENASPAAAPTRDPVGRHQRRSQPYGRF